MNLAIKTFHKEKCIIPLFFVFLIFSNCSFIEKNNYSFYETFINPDIGDLSEEFNNESEMPDLDSVPENVEIDE